MNIEFTGTIWYWRGPAPWYFIPIPDEQSNAIKDVSNLVTYGWGVIPVQVQIGNTTWSTSLIPKDGRYLIPIKAAIRKAEKLADDATVDIRLTINL